MNKRNYLSLIIIIIACIVSLFSEDDDIRFIGLLNIVFWGFMLLTYHVFNSKRFKLWFIKKRCPIIYSSYFYIDKDTQWPLGIWRNTSQDEYLSMTPYELLQEEKSLKYRIEKEISLKEKLKNLQNEEQNEDWYNRAIKFRNYCNYHRYLLNTQNFSLLSQAIDKFELIKSHPIDTIKESEDDITREDIINKTVEFTDHGIYANIKVWDGVKYTMKKQRVYVYKRSYHLDMGQPPRFHICRCSTMDNYIHNNTLEILYRKSNLPRVKVKNMDDNYKENEITHLPLCGNCYKIMKKQYSWLDSKMDNEDFIRNVINRVGWYKPNI